MLYTKNQSLPARWKGMVASLSPDTSQFLSPVGLRVLAKLVTCPQIGPLWLQWGGRVSSSGEVARAQLKVKLFKKTLCGAAHRLV